MIVDKLRNGGVFELIQRTIATFVQTAIAVLIVNEITDVNVWATSAVAGGLAALKVIGEFAAVHAKKPDAS